MNWRLVAGLAGRFAPVLLCVAGGLFFLYATVGGVGASLPYPDPTPELLDAQRRELDAAQADTRIGAGVMLTGMVWWGVRWSLRRRRLQIS